jgi:hypothetical protein
MSTLVPPPALVSTFVVCWGRYGAVTQFAQQRGVCRQALYRDAHHVLRALDRTPLESQLTQLRQQVADTTARLQQAQQQLALASVIDLDKQTEFAATAQAVGVSLAAAHTLLAIFLGERTPSVATLGRRAKEAGHRASALLPLLDTHSRARARQVAADEIFVGHQPVLMTLEQDSGCWLGGRLAPHRDGAEWAAEFRALPAAEQVTRDGGVGLRKGLQQVNRERQQAGQTAIADQMDHFHLLQWTRRAMREARHQATQALRRADKAQQGFDRDGRLGVRRSAAQGGKVRRYWTKAEQAFDRWSADARAFEQLRASLRLFTPEGELNTRPRAEAEVQTALAGRTGTVWQRARRLLGPVTFTFLDRVQAHLAALPVAPELRRAVLRLEGLRRRPEALRGEGPSARALRGVVVAAGLALSLAGPAGSQAQRLVRAVLDGAWRSSSLVEGLNSVVRMQQARHKRLTQGLLDLKRLHWNMHLFRAGKRKGQTPYGRLGLVLPTQNCWSLLKMTPEQLRLQLSELNRAA